MFACKGTQDSLKSPSHLEALIHRTPGKHPLSHPEWNGWVQGEGFLTRPNNRRDLANRNKPSIPQAPGNLKEEPGASADMMRSELEAEWGGGEMGER